MSSLKKNVMKKHKTNAFISHTSSFTIEKYFKRTGIACFNNEG